MSKKIIHLVDKSTIMRLPNLLFFTLIILTIFIGGCTQSPAPSTPTQPSTLIITLTPTQMLTQISTPTPTTQRTVVKYVAGDMIQHYTNESSYDPNRAWVIIKVEDEAYLVGHVNYDLDVKKWYKMDDDSPEQRVFNAVERDYPVLLQNINWDNLPLKYATKNCQGDNVISWEKNPCNYPVPNMNPSYSSSGSTVFYGYGDDVVSFTATGTGLRIFNMQYNGQQNFIVWLKDGMGNNIDLIANKIGSYNGRTSVQLTTGKYYLDVKSSGSWTITITSI
jgi:hypothetical protein